MAAGRWAFDTDTTMTAVGLLFSGSKEPVQNPYARLEEIPLTPEEIAEEEAAAARIAAIKEKVFKEQQEQRNGSRRQ
jgi:hypothetical protein